MFFYRSRMVRSSLLILFLIVLLPVGVVKSSTRAYAASTSISVDSQTYTVHYPDYIDFNLSASDTGNTITRAFLHLNFNNGATKEQFVVTPPKPSSHVQLKWHYETTGDSFFPQGTPVTFYWEIDDTAGSMYASNTQNFVTVDTRFNWQEQVDGFVHVHWYDRDQTFGQFVLKQTVGHVNRIQTKLGTDLNHDINIWIYSTVDDFKGSLDPGAYEWVGGEARPALNEAEFVVVDSSDDRLVRDMPHELTHLLFHQIIQNGIDSPTWFDEGMAVENQIFHEQTMTLHFQEALQRHTLFRLSEISAGFPADSYKADLAYAQSWQLVNYMYKTFGQAKMTALIKSMGNANNDFDTDLVKALGLNQNHLENQWRLSLHQSSILTDADKTGTNTSITATPTVPQAPAQDNTSLILTIAGIGLLVVSIVLLVILMVARQRQRSKILAVQAASRIAAGPYYQAPPNGYMPQPLQNGYMPQVAANRQVPQTPQNGYMPQAQPQPFPAPAPTYPPPGGTAYPVPFRRPEAPQAQPSWNGSPELHSRVQDAPAPQE